jgi:hypothetical protein
VAGVVIVVVDVTGGTVGGTTGKISGSGTCGAVGTGGELSEAEELLVVILLGIEDGNEKVDRGDET